MSQRSWDALRHRFLCVAAVAAMVDAYAEILHGPVLRFAHSCCVSGSPTQRVCTFFPQMDQFAQWVKPVVQVSVLVL